MATFICTNGGGCLNQFMANQRKAGQTFIGFQGDDRLVSALDQARIKLRQDRSLFVRIAIAEKLERLNYKIPEDWIMPPMRETKEVMLNEGAVSEPLTATRRDVVYSKRGRPKKDATPNDTNDKKFCSLSRNCPEACPILDRFDVRYNPA